MKWMIMVLWLAGCPAMQTQSGPSASTMPAPGPAPGPAPAVSADGKLAMPNLVGKTEQEAKQILASAGFQSEAEVNSHPLECEGAAHDEGKINCQSPEAGQPAGRNAIINLTVFHASTHAGRYNDDDTAPLVGMTLDAAKKKLAAMGFHGKLDVIDNTDIHATQCKQDTVCSIFPTQFQSDSEVTLRIMKAQMNIAPPD